MQSKNLNFRQPLPQMWLGKLDIYLQKTETRSMFVILYKYQLSMDKDLNLRLEALKLVQERARNTL
jgi:hypothetical protein